MPPPYTQEQRFIMLNNFYGYGNIETAKIAFIGIEEGWRLSDNENILDDKLYRLIADINTEFIRMDDFNERYWQNDNSWSNSLDITQRCQVLLSRKIRKLMGEVDLFFDDYEYFRNEFRHNFELQLNIYPIPCPSASQEQWTAQTHYQNLFGIPNIKDEYKQLPLVQNRINNIFARLSEHNIIKVFMSWGEAGNLPPIFSKNNVVPINFYGTPYNFNCRANKDLSSWLIYHPSYFQYIGQKGLEYEYYSRIAQLIYDNCFAMNR